MIEPKPVISRKDYFLLPESERPKTGNCLEHGDFEIKSDTSLPIHLVMATCPKCSKLYKDYMENINKTKDEDERKKREKEMFELRMSNAGVTKRHFDKSFSNYRVETKEQEYALKSIKFFVDKVLDGECKNVIMCGSVGTGKTHLGIAALRDIIERTQKARLGIYTVVEMIRYYRSSWSAETSYNEQDVVNELSNMQLLIIDELGVQSGKEAEINTIFEIINNRYNNKLPTMIISNLDLNSKNENDVTVCSILGDRMIDRLKEDGCRTLGMAWPSYRETNKNEF